MKAILLIVCLFVISCKTPTGKDAIRAAEARNTFWRNLAGEVIKITIKSVVDNQVRSWK